MNYKKIISSFISAAVFLGTAQVMAADITVNTPSVNGTAVTISGKAPSSNTRVFLEIVRKDKSYKDKNNVYFATQIFTDEDGNFSAVCEMPDKDREDSKKTVNGYFTAYASVPGYGRESVDFSYISEWSRTEFFRTLNGLSDAKALESFIQSEDNRLMFDAYNVYAAEFSSLSDEKGIKTLAASVIKNKNLVFTKDNINIINEVIIAMRLNGLSDEQAVKSIIESSDIMSRCNLVYDAVSGNTVTYDTASTDEKEWFLKVAATVSKNNGFSAVEDLNTLFAQTMALKKINETHYSNVYEILDINKSVLGLTSSETFQKINSINDKTAVMKNLKDLSEEIQSVSELETLLTSAYESYLQSISGGGNESSYVSSTASSNKKTISTPSNIITSGSVPKNEDVKTEPEKGKEYFNDLSGHEWAKDAVNTLAANGIVSGYGDGSFLPNKNVTRAEFLTMLLTAVDLVEENASCNFADVSRDDWSYKYIASAYAKGITSGIDENNFGKDNLITRQEAVTFMHRAAVKAFIPLESGKAKVFDDEDSIANWAKRSVRIMNEAGLVNGMEDNKFMPNEYTTRAQAAKMIFALYELM